MPRPQSNWKARLVEATAAVAATLAIAAAAVAGGGPQNVLLVVNANSADSKQVANHYVRLRGLPPGNVLYVDYRGDTQSVSVEEFREQILKPVLTTIDGRKLAAQIDTVAYSTDFPWKIDLRGDFEAGRKFSRSQEPFASLTGATYLYGMTMQAPEVLLSLDSNWYAPPPSPNESRMANATRCQSLGAARGRAFRSVYSWRPDGAPTLRRDEGRRYLMSTSLGVTTGRGLTVAEVMAALDRAAEADADPPDGTFYFLKNSNVRSVVRHGCYGEAVRLLNEAGGKAVVRDGVLPDGAADVLGLMTGAADLDLDSARLRFQPGAIAEHLTSYGGLLFSDKDWQTPLTDLIRAGATGASGTVHEPTALQAKFPLPTLQVHYRRGASLAEAFYLSVASPYQLLIVGDPLCQPWAKRPSLQVAGWPDPPEGSLESVLDDLDLFGAKVGPARDAPTEGAPANEPASGESPGLTLTPTVGPDSERPGGYFEIYVDGRVVIRKRSGEAATVPDEALGLGWTELRCVGVSADPFEWQTVRVGSVERLDPERGVAGPVRLKVDSPSAALGEELAVSATAPGAERVSIRQNHREVGAIKGERGSVPLSTDVLGAGPVRLQAVAEPSGAASPPVWVEVR